MARPTTALPSNSRFNICSPSWRLLSFPRRHRLDRQRVDPFLHQLAERGIDFSLPLDPVEAGECGAFDGQREMALAARVMAGMADMLVALVFQLEAGGREGGGQPLDHFAGNGSGGGVRHRHYIEAFEERGTSGAAADQMARTGGGRREPLLG